MSKLLEAASKKRKQPKDPIRERGRSVVDSEVAAAWKSGNPDKIRQAIRLLEDMGEDDD